MRPVNALMAAVAAAHFPPALAQQAPSLPPPSAVFDRVSYCDVPEVASRIGNTDVLNRLLVRCRPGDLVAVPARNPEWVARLCDLAKPTVSSGAYVTCHLVREVRPFISGSGLPSELREQPIGRRP